MYDAINVYAKERCPLLCENVEYHIRTPTSGSNYMEVVNKTTLWVFFSGPKIKIEEEYVLMGTNAIISATGGSLGLFLGLSCYGVAWKILEKVGTAFSSLIRSWRKRKARTKRDAEDIERWVFEGIK